MRHFQRQILFCMLLCWAALCAKAQATTTINFNMPGSYTTSAGVFKPDGTLVRTLWRKVPYSAGPQTATWDDKDDSGTTMPAGTYQVRVLYHNVNYVWEGTIGNTASAFTGYIRRGFNPMSDMAVDGTEVFTAMGYNENQPGLQRASTSAIQTLTYNNPKCITTSLDYVTTDGNWYYVANTGKAINFGANQTFVTAYKVSDNTQANFTSGVSVCQQTQPGGGCYAEHYFPNVIDKEVGVANPATGLAVQKTGSKLAVAHGSLNTVKIFDKTSGSLTGTISITNPGRIIFAPSGDLWVISGTTLRRFAAATLGSTNTPATTISGFSAPLAVSVHPSNNNIVMVADGGTSHQVKSYTSTGTLLNTFGTAGGYASSPAVSNSKFGFIADKTYIAVLSDGSFWVADGLNDRSIHLSSTGTYIEQIMYLPADYLATSDPNVPERVIGHNWLEFQVDYSQPLLAGDPSAAGGNNSWKLVKNWGIGAPAQNRGGIDEGLNTVVTLSNGRTYAFLRNYTSNQQDVFELPPSGNLRYTGVSFPRTATLYANGAVRDYSVAGGVQTVTQRNLTGFDGAFNPIWATATTLAAAPAGTLDPYYRGAFSGPTGPRFPITSSNTVVSFDQSVGTGANAGMHLGGMTVGGSQWLWKASPAANGVDYTNAAQQNGTFDIGSGTNYGGNMVHSNGRNIVYGYHGEFWNNGQANQFMHFWDDGLFVGQFGVPNFSSIFDARAGISGNAFSPSIVKANGETYYWVNDESNHNGVHRWKLANANNIAELIASGPLGGTITPVPAFPGAPTNLTATAGNAQVVLNWTAVSGATSYNVYRGTTSNGQSATAVATGISGATYTNTGLTNGATYYYKVKAVNGAGTGAYSNEASATPASPTASIPYATTALAIDGGVDSAWSSATAQNIISVVAGSTTVTGSWKAMWDNNKLYILATVSDGSLVTGTANYNGDSIELYVDADNSKNTTYGANDFQYILGWSASGATISEYAHSATTGVLYSQVNITGGYRMEFAIPWTTLGVTPVANNSIGIDAGIDDAANTTSRAGQVMWCGTSLNFQNPSLFGTGTLLPPPAPAAPTGLSATAGNAQIVLNWTAVSGATSYNVYRGTTSNGQSSTAIATGISGTTYTNTGLTNGTTYYYKIKAVNAGGTSAYSNEASTTPFAGYGIVHATSVPTIDGGVDSVWSSAPSQNITSVVAGSTAVTGSWKAMWDSSKLYILATVSDSSLISGTANYNGDSVELYIDADNSKSATYGGNDFQYILGWNASSAAISEYAHGATTGVLYDQTNISGGYRMEFAIPWTTLGVTPAANNFVGIDVGIDDAATTTSRAGQVMWFGGANNYVNPSLFGIGKLLP